MMHAIQVNRFGWMFDEDIEVLSAVAMPMGNITVINY